MSETIFRYSGPGLPSPAIVNICVVLYSIFCYYGSCGASCQRQDSDRILLTCEFSTNPMNSVFEIAKIVIIALLIVLPLRAFVFQPFLVRGESMEPNFHNGDYLIVDELSYRFGEPGRGDVVVFKYPQDTSQRYIKRLIGLPGDIVKIQEGMVFVSDSELNESVYLSTEVVTAGAVDIQLGENEYFVLGDNRQFSSDSRRWGVLPRDHIVGRALLRLFPPTALAKVEAPTY
jgi:signal peptidase I